MSRSYFKELDMEAEAILQEWRACSRHSSRPVSHVHEHRSLMLDCGQSAHRNKHTNHTRFGHGFWKIVSCKSCAYLCWCSINYMTWSAEIKPDSSQKDLQSSLSPRWLVDTAWNCRNSLLPSKVVSSFFTSAYKAGRNPAGKWGLLWPETEMENTKGEARNLSV